MWNSPCMKWNVFHICLPHISVYKMDILLLFLYFVFQILDFSWFIHFIHFLWLEDFDPAGTGQHDGIHTGTKQRGNTTGNQTGGNNEKMRNVTSILGYMDYMWLYGLCVVLWVMWVICGYYPQSYIHLYIYIYVFLYVLSTITFQTFSGSFSRHRSLKETSIWLTDLQVSVSVQTGTFQKIANNIYVMEMPDFGTNDSKEKCSCM